MLSGPISFRSTACSQCECRRSYFKTPKDRFTCLQIVARILSIIWVQITGMSIPFHPYIIPLLSVSLFLCEDIESKRPPQKYTSPSSHINSASSINISVRSIDFFFFFFCCWEGRKLIACCVFTFTPESVFCCQATFSTSDVLFAVAPPPLLIQWCKSASKFTEQLCRP